MRIVMLVVFVSVAVVGTASAQMPSFNDVIAPFKDIPAKVKEMPERFKVGAPGSGTVTSEDRQGGPPRSGLATTSKRIDINRASVAELTSLPDVDDTLARKIVDGRPYHLTTDLASRHVVPSQVYTRIQTRITVGGESPGAAPKKRRCSEVGGRVSCRDN